MENRNVCIQIELEYVNLTVNRKLSHEYEHSTLNIFDDIDQELDLNGCELEDDGVLNFVSCFFFAFLRLIHRSLRVYSYFILCAYADK